MNKKTALAILSISLISISSPALFATWTIIAVDTETQEVGAAGASFTPAVWLVLGIVGGKGVIVAQAETNLEAKQLGMTLLLEEINPEEIIEQLTDPSFDPTAQKQQYGIVTLYNGSAGFTGSMCMKWAGHIGNDIVMIQGNILVSEDVIKDVMAAYKNAQSQNLPLAERLVLAMLAGSKAGGDKRGGDATAMTAFLAIASPDDSPGSASQSIIITPQAEIINPVVMLAEKYYKDSGQLQPAHFPDVKSIILIFLVLPLAVGIFTGFIFFKLLNKKKALIWVPITLSTAPLSALIIYSGLRLCADLLHYILPLFGLYQTIVLIVLGVMPFVILSAFIGIRGIVLLLIKMNR